MLPGIVGYSFCMPDIHQGYGFPIGGVAAFREDQGIISPGGVGYDISCGVRLMVSDISAEELKPMIPSLASTLATKVPCGMGSHGALAISRNDLISVLETGAAWAVRKGLGETRDLRSIEASGCIEGANPDNLSPRAMEEHQYRGKKLRLCIHRKGATRALPPGHIDLPQHLKDTGQPVLIHESMGTASYVLVGTRRGAEECFASTCHGAGRFLSRHVARKTISAGEVISQLREKDIFVQAENPRTLEEEAPVAYKDMERVIDIVEHAGISRRVARMKPLGVLKG